MVHVGVRKQNGVDRREIGNAEAGPPLTPKDDEARGKYGVDKQCATGSLDEERGMTDEGYGGITGRHLRWLG